jgi:hypothetical protein
LITILGQGARFEGDAGWSEIVRVTFKGYDIPEFDASNNRNWKFYPGTITTMPIYKTATVDHTTNTFTATAHGYNNGDEVAFSRRQTTSVLPTPIAGGIQKYFIINKTADTFQVSLSAPPSGAAVDITNNGTGAFAVYKADAGFFDPIQGVSWVFPNLLHTFSGLARLDILFPSDFSESDEPQDLKVIVKGKEVKTYTVVSGSLVEGVSSYTVNNALIAIDHLRYDAHLPLTRIGTSFINKFKPRCDALITWAGGNSQPQTLYFDQQNNVVVDQVKGKFTKTGGPDYNGYVGSRPIEQNTANASVECLPRADGFTMGFVNTVVTGFNNGIGVHGSPDGYCYLMLNATVTRLSGWSRFDRFLVEKEGTTLRIIRNGELLHTTTYTPTADFFVRIELKNDGNYAEQCLMAPSGTATVPRQVARYTGHAAYVQATNAADAYEAQFLRAPEMRWQDVNGKIEVLDITDVTPVHTFHYDSTILWFKSSIEFPATGDPTKTYLDEQARKIYKWNATYYQELAGVNPYSNIWDEGVSVEPRQLETLFNYYRLSFRDESDPLLQRKYAFVDREALRVQAANTLVATPVLHQGVMTQSLAERMGHTFAALQSDLPFKFNVEAPIDSYHVAKGDFVELVDASLATDLLHPILCMVMSEKLHMRRGEIESRQFELQLITNDFYSDTAHGAVSGALPYKQTSALFAPPPDLTALVLNESTETVPPGRVVSSINGLATFQPFAGQRARVWLKRLGTGAISATASAADDKLTANNHSLANGTAIELIAGSKTLPAPLDERTTYYVIAATTNTFQLALTPAGSAIDLTTDGTGAYIFPLGVWQEQSAVLLPNPTSLQSPFEIFPAAVGWNKVRVQPQSAGGVRRAFDFCIQSTIEILGITMPPEAPTNLDYIYDGVNIIFSWEAVVTAESYQLRDSSGLVIFQGAATTATVPARLLTEEFRVYSIRNSILSNSYAATVFTVPPVVSWAYITGAGITATGALKKSAPSQWGNCGAIATHGFLSGYSQVSYVADTANQYKIFGMCETKTVDSYDDIKWGIYLMENGNFEVRELGVQKYVGGAYQIGERFYVRVNADNTVDYLRRKLDNTLELLYTSTTSVTVRPLFAGVSLYTQNSYFQTNFALEGLLFAASGRFITPQNRVNVTIDPDDQEIHGAGFGAWNTSGLSSMETLGEFQDGLFSFKFGQTNKFVVVGWNTTDSDQDVTSIPFGIYCYDNGNVFCRQNNTDTFLDTTTTNDVWSASREAGGMIIRKNGVKIFPTVGSILLAGALLIDVSFYSTGSIKELKLFKPVTKGLVAEQGFSSHTRADMRTPVLVSGVPSDTLVLRGAGNLASDDFWLRGSDRATPDTRYVGTNGAAIVFVQSGAEGSSDVIGVQIETVLPIAAPSNFTSVRRVRIRVLNRFGEQIHLTPPIPIALGGGLLPMFYIDKTKALHLSTTIFCLSFENAYGWSNEVFLSGMNAVTQTIPAFYVHMDCPHGLNASEGHDGEIKLGWLPATTNAGTQGVFARFTLPFFVKGYAFSLIKTLSSSASETTINLTSDIAGISGAYSARQIEFYITNGLGVPVGVSNVVTVPVPVAHRAGPTFAPVVQVFAVPTSNTTATIKYTDEEGAADTYDLWRDGVEIATGLGATYNDTGLIPGQIYVYQVQSNYAQNASVLSAPVWVKMPAVPDLGTPSNLTGIAISNDRIDLTWNLNGNSGAVVFEYKVYDYDLVSGWTVVNLSSGVNSRSQTGLSAQDSAGKGLEYVFRVKAGTSAYSNYYFTRTLPHMIEDKYDPKG